MSNPDVLTLRSPHISVNVEPDRGLSITSLRGADGDEWIQFDPSRGPRALAADAAYDDVWRGGFEELFPNDAPGPFDGRALPDHGELWSSPFAVHSATPLAIRAERQCTSVPARVEKHIQLFADAPSVRLWYRITNQGDDLLRFLFKLHLSARVEPGDRLVLPGGVVTPVVPGFGALERPGASPWPVATGSRGEALDLSLVRPAGECFREFVYVRDLPDGYCGLRRGRSGTTMRLAFDRAVFPSVWLFITYGGWRDYNTAVLEPCTNWPKDLAAAALHGECAVLAPGAALETAIRLDLES